MAAGWLAGQRWTLLIVESTGVHDLRYAFARRWWRWRWRRRVDALLRAELAARSGTPVLTWRDPAVQAARAAALCTLERLTWDEVMLPPRGAAKVARGGERAGGR